MNKLESFLNIHRNSSIVVCGCGESLNDLAQPERFITIGVNDVGRRFQPNYLVVVNPRDQFSGDRFQYVENSRAGYLFTQLDLGVGHPNVVKFKLGTFGGTDFSSQDVLHYTNNSPYIALHLAILMGAKRIGLIGVDFTDHHFFGETGTHPLAPQFDSINGQYSRLAEAAKARGIEIFNLSRISRLTAFPKISVDEFAGANPSAQESETDLFHAGKSSPLTVVSYATTPVAGVPAILARCINARTEHSARCVWATDGYGNGVSFAGDVEWQNAPRIAEDLLREADLIVVHNGKVAPEHEKFFAEKPVVTMAHNYLWNVDERFVKAGFPGVVVGQYQAALDEFKDWSVVPNPIPFWETEYQPGKKPEEITICYTPSGKHEKYPPSHRLYWHSKGYETTVRVLEKLARRFPLKLEIIRDRQISHAESLAMKRRSHIVIDECVTGSYHRNSLEGLASGAVVVNGLGILPKVADVLQFCAGSQTEIPFVPATLERLEDVLKDLIESGRENLLKKGAENRAWLENHWDFSRQWTNFWIPAIEKSFCKVKRKFNFTVPPIKAANENLSREVTANLQMREFKKGVSVVIPHGGQYRLPHLRACLANLRQCEQVGEIIVVEMDEKPLAAELARKWADKYVFIRRQDSFERARALNIGSAFAECEFVMWLDNDLLIPHDFINRAAAELRQRNLDFLKPYSEIRYLSLADSEKAMQGIVVPDQCRPANIFTSAATDGGTGLMRREFLQKFGGIPGGFQGWGGEDNGWMHKVALLGKGARTQFHDQKIYHLYHALSGGNGGDAHLNANPHYHANLSLLGRIRTIRNPQEFLESFPPTPNVLWEDSRRIYFVGDENLSENTARELFDLFGAKVEIIAPENLNKLKTQTPAAIVFFDYRLAFDFLARESSAQFAEKTLIVADKNCPLTSLEESKLRPCSGVLAIDETIAGKLRQSGLKHWFWESENHPELDFRSFALALAQPLSLIINGRTDSYKPENVVSATTAPETDLPVWLYWEGNCPEWIQACQKTILNLAPNACLLSPETFNELWTEDRDIRLENLHVAQRADFIRAFLLSHYGGAWIDSDCIVTKPLEPLFDSLREYDFAAHRERGGFFGNEFMFAGPQSRIARSFYEQISQTLRSGRNFGWCDLGCVPLTDVINKSDAPFYEIDCDLIQPICWSDVEPYFAPGKDSEHRTNFDRNAFCYMLSNLMVEKYLSVNPAKHLLDKKTFFSYLLRQSSKESLQSNHHPKRRVKKANNSDLPVWVYWEGARPAWIEACHRTIAAKAGSLRFLTPESFAELWTEDRDIELSHLYVAHRADFIRAYLLAKFGGLWLDADCIVMQDLQSLLDRLGDFDFIAHREREGLFTNDLMAAKKGSVIAREFYENVCRTLRRTKSLSWRAIGGEPLTEILENTDAPFLELDCERVQPICWSQPEKFFALGSDTEHARNFDENALCYMLSNGAVINYQSKNPDAELTAENSFFSYAVRRALKEQTSSVNNPVQDKNIQFEAHRNGANSRPMKNKNGRHTLSFYLETISKIEPRKVRDIDVGLGSWAVLLRDFFESSTEKKGWQISIEAVVEKKSGTPKSLEFFYDRILVGGLNDCFQTVEEKTDLLIMGDYLLRNSDLKNTKTLETALNCSEYVLLNLNRPNGSVNHSNGQQNLISYLDSNPEQVVAFQRNEDFVSFLLSQTDPKKLRSKNEMADIFYNMSQTFRRQREESMSGPGSSLKQTAEIRRSLPLLFSSLEINSMLDAPCGDFNWLRHVDLKLEQYIGIDVVPSIVEKNRNRYENQRRKFYVSDLARDFLPRCDLILCRDCLVHFSFDDVFAALRNFCKSGAKYLLTTTFPQKQHNTNIATGGWQPINFQLPPFNFPAPFKILNEKCTEGNGQFADKSLGLWLLPDIREIVG